MSEKDPFLNPEEVNNPENSGLNLEGNEWAVPSNTEVLGKIRHAFKARLIEAGWHNEDQIETLSLALDEAITNAIIHGNLGLVKGEDESFEEYKERMKKAMTDPCEHCGQAHKKLVHVNLDISPEELIVKINDHGPGLDPNMFEAPAGKTRGRGLKLIDAAFDKVLVESGRLVLKARKKD